MGSGWSFEYSFWIVNGWYVPDRNVTTTNTTYVDTCSGEANPLSAGFGLWLVLVPAIACVIQLPGSTFLYERSNFYRFSPELGLVEALSVIVLLVKGLLSGYPWHQSILGVLIVRDGIGRGDLWWRRDADARIPFDIYDEPVATDGPPGYEQTTAEQTQVEGLHESYSLGDIAQHNITFSQNKTLKRQLDGLMSPLSSERLVGTGLFVASLAKIITISTSSAHSQMLVPCILAIAYSFNFLVIEVLVWTILIPVRGTTSLKDIPPEHLVEVARVVDPGDNMFTFPAQLPNSIPSHKWNRALVILTSLPAFIGPVAWISLLFDLQEPSSTVLAIIITVSFIFGIRITFKLALCRLQKRVSDLFGIQYVIEFCSEMGSRVENTSMDHDNLFGVILFFITWILRRVSLVNAYSCIWIGLICYYSACAFQTQA